MIDTAFTTLGYRSVATGLAGSTHVRTEDRLNLAGPVFVVEDKERKLGSAWRYPYNHMALAALE